VHQHEAGDGAIELSFYERADDLPPRDELRAAAGVDEWTEQEVPDDPRERRRLHGRAWEIAGRLRVRSPDDPPGDGSVPELVIEPAAGAFGTGAHPTTRLCLELLPTLARGALLDLGCGSGVLAVAAAKLGFHPVHAMDDDPAAVQTTRANAERNAVAVDARVADVRSAPLPGVAAVVANIAREVVEAIATRVSAAELVASGYLAAERPSLSGWAHVETRTLDGWAADRFRRA
jgi:ribosomal protein L11 methyltransferase